MVHGTPDWGFAKQDTVHILSDDLAELAARLGSIHVYDRAGYILWTDDFSKGPGAWYSAVDGTGSSVELSAIYPLWPPYCLKMVAGSNGSRVAEIRRYFAPPVIGKIGIEVAICFLSDFDYFLMEFRLDDDSYIHRARITLDDTNDKVYYTDSDNALQELGGFERHGGIRGGYQHLKLVVDFSTDTYVRLLLDDLSYDLSSYDLRVVGDPSLPALYIKIELYGRDGQNDSCNIDGVIVTQNEV